MKRFHIVAAAAAFVFTATVAALVSREQTADGQTPAVWPADGGTGANDKSVGLVVRAVPGGS